MSRLVPDDGGVLVWHSSAKCIAELQPGDRMWMVTSGKGLREDAEQATFLVGVWAVREVMDNPNDNPDYPADDYSKRVVADPSGSVMLADPIAVDHILHPAGRDRAGREGEAPRRGHGNLRSDPARLFEGLGDKADHERTVDACWEKYRALGDDVSRAVKEPAYKQNMLAVYAFHPELLTAMYERWGSMPDFQGTRGVLRLLAFVVSDLYNRKDNELLIQSCDVILGISEIRGELVRYAGSAFHSVVDSDIAGPDTKSPEIDRSLGSEYAKESVSEKLAKAIFMYSISGGQQRRATVPQLRLAVLNPELDNQFVLDALHRMAKRLWSFTAKVASTGSRRSRT